MRSKLVLAALTFLSTLPCLAQVAPAARVSGLPLGIGAGVADYSVDYGPGRRMLGVNVWADYTIFHGFGIEAEGQSIQWDRPSSLSKMRQDAAKGGVIYKTRPHFGIRPYVKGMAGILSIDFPSYNPFYTHDTYLLYVAGGGAEYRVWRNLFARVDYEYQFVPKYHSQNTLDPQGFTIGATYYLRGVHSHR